MPMRVSNVGIMATSETTRVSKEYAKLLRDGQANYRNAMNKPDASMAEYTRALAQIANPFSPIFLDFIKKGQKRQPNGKH